MRGRLRIFWVVLAMLCVIACGSDSKKKKKAKKPKPANAGQRAEHYCKASCGRAERCDEADADSCMATCRNDRARRMHAYRPKFVWHYADCLDKLSCDKELDLCMEVAVASTMHKKKKAKALFERCHDRRVSCGGNWDARCDASVALNERGRESVKDCLRMPCRMVRACLKEAYNQ